MIVFGTHLVEVQPIYDQVLVSLVRRAMPNIIAYDLCGVQPMSGPTGLIFGLRAKYGPQKITSFGEHEVVVQ